MKIGFRKPAFKKSIAVVLISTAIIINSCQNEVKLTELNLVETSVAETLDSYGFVVMAATPGPTRTSVPTLEPRNIIESIIDDVRLNEYCNQELVPEIIKKFRLIDEDSTFSGLMKNVTSKINNPKMFTSEEEQKTVLEELKRIIDEVNAIKVPECLKTAKMKILMGYEEVQKVAKRNDSNWFPDLMGAGFIGQSGRDELTRIEQCLPSGCK